MKTLRETDSGEVLHDVPTWEESSGLLRFLSLVPEEVERFNHAFEFNIKPVVSLPVIDGNEDEGLKVGFVLVRDNKLLTDSRYCLYSVLRNRVLCGYIGIYSRDGIRTLKELRPITDFRKGQMMLYEWLRSLVRASCEKIMV